MATLAGVRSRLAGLLGGSLLRQAGWLLSSHVAGQAIRLLVNIILARLIAPQLFGIMLLVNTARIGIELLSDVGIGQNIVRHRDGMTPAFLDTAWTIQVIRGALLTLVGLVAAWPLSRFYDDSLIYYVFSACALMFLIDGLYSPGRFVFQKQQRIRELALFEIVVSLINAVVNVVIIWLFPTIWGLVAALLVTGAILMAASFYFLPLSALSFRIDRHYLREILHFGKWIFVASIIYFLSMNFDRLYLGAAVSFHVLGIYGIARSLSEALMLVAQRVGGFMIFPKIAQAHNDGVALRGTLGKVRWRGMLLIAAGFGPALALSDRIVVILYDDRYLAAAAILPVLMLGAWFATLATLADAVLLGIGKPGATATANAAKLAWMAVSVPLALTLGAFQWAVLAIAAAEIVRYLVLGAANYRHGLSFFRQDIAHTALMLAVALLFRMVLVAAGLAPGFADLLALARGLG